MRLGGAVTIPTGRCPSDAGHGQLGLHSKEERAGAGPWAHPCLVPYWSEIPAIQCLSDRTLPRTLSFIPILISLAFVKHLLWNKPSSQH